MKTVSIDQLYQTDFDCRVLSCLRQQWADVPSFSCLGSPKADELLLYLAGYQATYRFPDGTTKTARDGAAVYSPSGSEYLVTFQRTAAPSGDAHTVGIRFSLFSDGEPVRLSTGVTVFENAAGAAVLFEKEQFLCKRADSVPAEKKAALLELLAALGRAAEAPAASPGASVGNFETIRASYDFLNAHYESDASLDEIAAMSFVSPVWFRKLFKEKTGVSPAEYRQTLRLKQAESYLKFGTMSVREIAESVGYHDVSLFIRHFRRLFGVTPLALRKQFRSPD